MSTERTDECFRCLVTIAWERLGEPVPPGWVRLESRFHDQESPTGVALLCGSCTDDLADFMKEKLAGRQRRAEPPP